MQLQRQELREMVSPTVNTGDSSMFEMLFSMGLSVDDIDYFGLSLKDCCKKDGINRIVSIIV